MRLKRRILAQLQHLTICWNRQPDMQKFGNFSTSQLSRLSIRSERIIAWLYFMLNSRMSKRISELGFPPPMSHGREYVVEVDRTPNPQFFSGKINSQEHSFCMFVMCQKIGEKMWKVTSIGQVKCKMRRRKLYGKNLTQPASPGQTNRPRCFHFLASDRTQGDKLGIDVAEGAAYKFQNM